jgi:hypothetical protein
MTSEFLQCHVISHVEKNKTCYSWKKTEKKPQFPLWATKLDFPQKREKGLLGNIQGYKSYCLTLVEC